MRRAGGPAWDQIARRETLWMRAVLVGVVVLLVVLAHGTLAVAAGVRGYVRGEGLWSKARYEAMWHLERFVMSGDDADWRAFEAELAVPLADRRARLALDEPGFDMDAVVDDLITGLNHPADIPMMVRLYRGFGWQRDFARAIEIWREADAYVLELQALGAELRAASEAGALGGARRSDALQELRRIGRALAPLEHELSEAISAAGRWVYGVLRAGVVGAAALLLATGSGALTRLTGRVYAAEERFRRTFEQAPVGMVQLDRGGVWLDANEAMAGIMGVPRSRLVGTKPLDLLRAPDYEGGTDTGSVRLHRRDDGREAWLSSELTAIADRDGRVLHHVAVVQDVTESRRLAAELAHRARHDHLTGLLNRFEFERRMEESIEHAVRTGVPSALAFLDLDQFKQVNDTSGHAAGDALLVEVARVLRSSTRTGDTLARLGGDEFVILLSGCELAAARMLAEQVRGAIGALDFRRDGHRFGVGASIGLVAIDGGERDAGRVLSAADAACYAAKRAGRDRVHVSAELPRDAAADPPSA